MLAGEQDTGFIDAHLARLGAEPREPDAAAVLAGAGALWRERRSEARASTLDPWSVEDSFELTGLRRTPFDVRVDGKRERLVAIERCGGLDFGFADGRGSADRAGIVVEPVDDGVFVISGGRQCHVALVDALEEGGVEDEASSGDIIAPMHGRVIAVFVAEGQSVEAGAALPWSRR